MLFRPTADQNLPALETLLESWNLEADRFRRAAIAARGGEPYDPLTAQAAVEAHESVLEILTQIEAALERMPAGDRSAVGLLRAYTMALSLAESLERSCDDLRPLDAPDPSGPVHIVHEITVQP